MFKKTTKFEYCFFIFLFSLTLSFAILQIMNVITLNEKPTVAIVKYKNEEILKINLEDKDQVFEVTGTNGKILIQLKNHKVSIIEENSKNHICALQNETNSSLKPLVCLPNDIVIVIESDSKESVDSIIE